MTAEAVKQYLNLDGEYVLGMDISKWQSTWDGQVSWDQGVRFVIIRAGSITEAGGVLYEDYRLKRFALEAAKYPFLVGYYFYFRPNHDPIQQADFFYNLIRDMPRHMGMGCDIEKSGGMTAGIIDARFRAFIERLMVLSGDKVELPYSRGSIFQKWFGEWVGEHRLWYARFNSVIQQPWVPKAELPLLSNQRQYDPVHWLPDEWSIWQKSAGGNGLGSAFGVGSTSIDLDVFNGTEAELATWCDSFFEPPPEPPEPPEPPDVPEPTDKPLVDISVAYDPEKVNVRIHGR